MTGASYIIISPTRNEDQYLQRNIESIVSQTIRPSLWVIVNDGSTDKTAAIADDAVKQHTWIKVVHRADRGFRAAGSGVMEAFYAGYELIGNMAWDFLVKLDGDTSFEPDYFESCFKHFQEDSKLGIGGGTISNEVNGTYVAESEVDPVFHVRGATKIYKRACWDAIGGLIRVAGWDTVDEVKANMLGWRTRTFPDVRIIHHRLAGGAYGTWPNWEKNGKASYTVGYVPLFMIAKGIRRAFAKPYLIGALGLLSGYAKAYFGSGVRINDPATLRYFRNQQFRRLLGRPSIWT